MYRSFNTADYTASVLCLKSYLKLTQLSLKIIHPVFLFVNSPKVKSAKTVLAAPSASQNVGRGHPTDAELTCLSR